MDPAIPRIDAKAAVLAGLVAGAVAMLLQMLLAPLFIGGSVWTPPRMVAATVMGPQVLLPSSFGVAVLVGIAVQLLAAVGLAFAFAFLPLARSTALAVLVGAVLGMIALSLSYGAIAAFPWFAEARHWVTILNYILFGVLVGWIYNARARHTR